MQFAGLNFVAILAAAVASFMFGGVWYGVLSKPWMAAAGLSEEAVSASHKRGGTTYLMALAFVAQLIMAVVLAGLIGHLGPEQVTLRNGLISGLFVWAGFVLTAITVNHSFQMRLGLLTLIDGGHWLGVLLIQGAVIGLLGI
jgi:hypothetical protein